jgi:hypothetical protein
MIGPVRRESSTVVACVGEVSEPLLAGLARSPNIALVQPPEGDEDRLTAAARALAEAGRRAATYVLVTADPLAGVAAQWRAMWDLSAGPGAAAAFEEQAAVALARWRARQFELPDYYLVVTPAVPVPHAQVPYAPGARPSASHVSASHVSASHVTAPRASTPPASAPRASAPPATPSAAGPDLYLGPLRAARPRRVEAVVTGAGDTEAARVRQVLRALPHGPWWPPLDELLDTARHFYAGSLGGTGVQPSGQPAG